MEVDPTRICELLVGLGDVEVLGVEDEVGAPLRVHIRRRAPRPVPGQGLVHQHRRRRDRHAKRRETAGG